MALLKLIKTWGSGGSFSTPNRSAGYPDLKTLLVALLRASGLTGTATPDTTWWTTGITVTTNVATLATAGRVIAVEATAATSPGPKQQVQNGSPAAGTVDVAYDSAGVATLTFNGTDAVTACAVVQLGYSGDVYEIEV